MSQLDRIAILGAIVPSDEQSRQWLRVAWYLVLLVYHRRERSEYDVLSVRLLEQTRGSKFGKPEEIETMGQSMAQYVAEQAEARGEARGEERGRRLGEERTARRYLHTVLTTRFGNLPSDMETALEAADIEQLEQWHLNALTAESLEAVGILARE